MRKIILSVLILIIFLTGKILYSKTNERISITDAYAYPNPFNNEKDVTHIKFTINSDVTNKNGVITVVIYDFNGKKVWSREQRENLFTPTDTKEIIWGGENDLGRKVCKGLYFAKIIVEANNTCYKILKILIK